MAGNNTNEMDGYIYSDNVFSFEGAVSVEEKQTYSAPWRINYAEKDLFPFLKDKIGKYCSGVRLCFTTDADTIALQLAEPDEADEIETLILDVFVNGAFNQQINISDTSPVFIKKLSSEVKEIEIWLMQNHTFRLHKLYLSRGARVAKTVNKMKRWVHYGSSISQSNAASSPSKTWASMTAQKLNLHLTNLGLSGECVFDPMVALQIRELPADYITLKLGINAYPGRQTERMFAPSIIGFIKIIREKHPNVPLTIVSPIYSEDRETNKGECGLSLIDMRAVIKEIVDYFKSYGDRNIYYVSGLEILGEDNKQLYPDGLHPNAEAQYIMSENFKNKVFYKMPDIM